MNPGPSAKRVVVPIRRATEAKGLPLNEPPKPKAPPSRPTSQLFAGRDELRKVMISGADLLERQDEPVQWAWHGIVQGRDQVEIAGATYSGKSTFTFLMHVAALAPNPVELFGREVTPIPPGKVSVLVNVEQQASSIRRKLIEACEALGQDPAVIFPRILVIGRSGFCQGHPAWEHFCQAVTKKEIDVGLITFDSRARILQSSDANAEADQSRAAQIFGTIAERAECPVYVVSHLRKTQKERRTVDLDDVAGHHQRAAGADVVLLVEAERDDDGSVVSTRVRVAKRRDDGNEEHPPVMSFAIVREPGRPARLLTGAVASSKPSESPIQERLYALLKSRGELTKTGMSKALGASGKTVEKGISLLFAEKRIELVRTERSRNGVETRFFAARLTQAEVNAELWGGRDDV